MNTDPRPLTVFPPRRRLRWPLFVLGAVLYLLGLFFIGVHS